MIFSFGITCLEKVIEGISIVTFENRLCIVTKKTFNGGQSYKFFAEEAGEEIIYV